MSDAPLSVSAEPSALAWVPFVSVANMMRLVHRIGLERMLVEMTDAIAADFLRWPQFDKIPRVANHAKDGVVELMPIADGMHYAFKYVNGHPKNTRDGLQTVTAFGMLAEMSSGYPVLLSEMTLLTALRTAATSALATKHLAPAGASVMAMIGNGAQSEFQAIAQKAVNGITSMRLYDSDPAARAKCAANLRGFGLDVTDCATAEEAILGAHVITTCTADKQMATILTDNMIGAGVHINAIGGDCPGKTELHPDILRRSAIFVEYPEQTRIEGEIQQLPPDHPVTELWELMAGRVSGRTSAREITLFDGVGFAIEDFSALRVVRSCLAHHPDLCEKLDMIADPDDPRDLFGMLMRNR